MARLVEVCSVSNIIKFVLANAILNLLCEYCANLHKNFLGKKQTNINRMLCTNLDTC
jgi:hypothetical protein